MLSAIVRFSIRFRGIVVALAALVVGYGLYAASESRVDVFPEFAPGLVIANAEAPGLSAGQVETLVTQPIENALGGIIGLDTIRSRSLAGLSVVTLTFKSGTDVHQARQLVAERLQSVRNDLPAQAHAPTLLPLTSSTGTVTIFGLTSRERSPAELRTVAQWIVKPRILAVPGVADAVVFGGDVEQYGVRVSADALFRHNLGLQDIIKAASAATGVSGAGFVETANQRIPVVADAQARTAADIAHSLVRFRDGVGLRLGDVAQVRLRPAPRLGDASIMGERGVMVLVDTQYGADPLKVTRGIDRALDQLAVELKAEHVVLHPGIFRSAGFIEVALTHLGTALLVGSALVVVVLFLFLLQARTALISVVAIPLSLLGAVCLLHAFGVALDTMTLGGLAIALGEVVDDAIVDVENIHRRLRANAALDVPAPAARVVLLASLEVRGAVVFATLIVIVAFVPVVTLSGVAGALFAPLGFAYIAAVVASLAVALTVTPALCYLLLARRGLRTTEPRWIGRLKQRYVGMLGHAESRPGLMATMVAVAAIAAVGVLPFLSPTFIPDLREGHYILHVTAVPGTSLEEMMRAGARVSAAVRQVHGVRLVAQRAGRAADLVDPAGPEVSEIEIELDSMSGSEQQRTLDAIGKAVASFPGLTTSINTFLKERLDETISGSTAPLVISVFGNDLDVIDEKAREIVEVVGRIRGAVGLSMQAPPGGPEVTVRVRRARLEQLGLTPRDVLDVLQAAQQGVRVAQIYRGGRAVDVVVGVAGEVTDPVLGLGALPLRTPEGRLVPLREVAQVEQAQGRSQILHTGGQRVQAVSVHVRGRSVGDFTNEARAAVARAVAFPRGTYAVFAGESQARSAAQRDLWVRFTMAAAGIVVLLFLGLRTARAALLVMANLPFAMVGGVLAVASSGGQLSLGSMVGFVTLFGITLRNSIMLVSHYEHLVHEEGRPWGAATATLGASERLVPILMTALATALALLPLAVLSGEPGNEIEGPMAIVILGGLVSSTVLNLLVLPAMALRWGRFQAAPWRGLGGEGAPS